MQLNSRTRVDTVLDQHRRSAGEGNSSHSQPLLKYAMEKPKKKVLFNVPWM